MTIRIVSARNPSQGVDCVIFELGWDDTRGCTILVADGADCPGGLYRLRRPDHARLLKIVPLDGHWTCTVALTSDDQVIQVPGIDDNLDHPWWQRVVGVAETREGSGAGIRIGIVDHLFSPSDSLRHVNFIDTPARAQQVLRMRRGAQATHGQRVSAILAARGPGKFKGIADGADVYFKDSSYIADGYIDDIGVDSTKVMDGIKNLSDVHQADLIVLSLGFDQLIPELADYIESAADAGALCICAAGNTAEAEPTFPASMTSTVGVGGIGFDKVAPAGTSVQQSAQFARRSASLGKEFADFGCAFHDVNASHGPGLDVSGPSLGIVIRQPGGQIAEYRGTSYATPIVTGVLACTLATDATYAELAGRERYAYARDRLFALCCDLGLDAHKVGRGMPRL